MKDQSIVEGEYLFTIDTAHSDPNEIDCGWSETPNEHKCYNVSKLSNGQFAAQPNNRTRWFLATTMTPVVTRSNRWGIPMKGVGPAGCWENN